MIWWTCLGPWVKQTDFTTVAAVALRLPWPAPASSLGRISRFPEDPPDCPRLVDPGGAAVNLWGKTWRFQWGKHGKKHGEILLNSSLDAKSLTFFPSFLEPGNWAARGLQFPRARFIVFWLVRIDWHRDAFCGPLPRRSAMSPNKMRVYSWQNHRTKWSDFPANHVWWQRVYKTHVLFTCFYYSNYSIDTHSPNQQFHDWAYRIGNRFMTEDMTHPHTHTHLYIASDEHLRGWHDQQETLMETIKRRVLTHGRCGVSLLLAIKLWFNAA